jgi:hypothetical protein
MNFIGALLLAGFVMFGTRGIQAQHPTHHEPAPSLA